MAHVGASLRAVLVACAVAAASAAEELRGAAAAKVGMQAAAAAYPMKEVPTNPNSNLAMLSLLSAIVVPFAGIGVMLALKEKAWWGACYLIGGLVTLVWVYT